MEGKANPNMLRTLNNDFSIRKGKHGAYAFYQTKAMPKPKFMNIKNFNEGYGTCQISTLVNWLCKTYEIENIYTK